MHSGRLISLFLLGNGLFLSLAGAQSPADLREHHAFFDQQSSNYQDWLVESGIGQVLKVEHLKLTKDSVFLYLAFVDSDFDYQLNALHALQDTIRKKSVHTLEEKLFYKAIFFLEIPNDRLVIQLFDNYNIGSSVLFWQAIMFKDGSVSVRESGAKPILKIINISGISISEEGNQVRDNISGEVSKPRLFEEIYQFFKNKYQGSDCEGLTPRVLLRESGRRLWIQVDNLCKEALYEQTNNVLCRILNRLQLPSCNTIRRERFHFKVDYDKIEQGGELIIEIDGEYSTNTLLGYGQYQKMDYRFMDYFQVYADVLVEDLKKAIGNNRH
ncbi:MAG: hypothetical protein R2824_13435 [Saprospiraceae bacterium]|nr:hypothetical protein [Lewinella sp.]